MAGAYMNTSAHATDLLASDPTISLSPDPDTANGPIPSPFTRYNQPLPSQWIPLYKKPMRTPTRRLRVVVIGAGLSAMTLAHKIYHEHGEIFSSPCPLFSNASKPEEKKPLVELCIYEAGEEIGGTWRVNNYPGVACDVPAHIYTFPFEPNPDWSAYYAGGAEILSSFKKAVGKHELDRDVKCGHRVVEARFNVEKGKWELEVSRKEDGKEESFKDECDVLISATGFLSKWRWPGIDGLHDFNGKLCHSAAWDEKFDWTDQRVGIIGNGSSGIQILPCVAKGSKQTVNFVRRPTYITPGLGSAIIDGKEQYYYSEGEKQRFREHPEELKKYRKRIQAGSNQAFDMFVKDSEAQQQAYDKTAELMKEKLGGDEALAEKLTPKYEVGCRRITPGPGYLESFQRDNVDLVTEPITRIESNGIRTADGTLHELDAIICATGFDVSHAVPWVGRHGTSLAEAWKDEPTSYLSLAAAGFPNFFMFSGPNAPVGHGSLMAGLGWSADYMCQWIRKMAEEDILWVDAKREAVDEFNAYGDEIMQTLVWSGGCQSWYKNHRVNGKVTAVWPGSAIGYKAMIDHIRPEDFEIRYRTKNRFRFMGNGRTALEYQQDGDLAFYLYK